MTRCDWYAQFFCIDPILVGTAVQKSGHLLFFGAQSHNVDCATSCIGEGHAMLGNARFVPRQVTQVCMSYAVIVLDNAFRCLQCKNGT